MGAIVSQITGVSIVYLTVCSGVDQRKHQSSATLAFAGGIHRWPVNSPHKRPVTRKTFPFDDVIILVIYIYIEVADTQSETVSRATIDSRLSTSLRWKHFRGPFRWQFSLRWCQITIMTSRITGQCKETSKARVNVPLWGESTGDRWIPRTKGQ